LPHGAGKTDVVELLIPSNPSYLSMVRSVVGAFARQAGFDDGAADAIVVGVDEAVANVIRHCYKMRPDRGILLRCSIIPGGIELRLRDFGAKTDPVDIVCARRRRLRPGGLGLKMIKQVMDTVRYDASHPIGNELVMVKFRRRRGRAIARGAGRTTGGD